MCTVSWLTEGSSYTILFNRDERKTRARALPPAIRAAKGAACIAPKDPDGKGTWIGANTHGFACCVLNNYRARAESKRVFTSRGLIAESILACHSQQDALDRLHELSLDAFQPFHLLLFECGRAPLLCNWDGSALSSSAPAAPFTSSSFDTDTVIRERAKHFPENPGLADLMSFHASHVPHRSAYSVCMHRPDAETVSFSKVFVSPEAIDFTYLPASLCRKNEVVPHHIRMER